MPQMTHSRPIKKAPDLTQAWLDDFEKYRQRTALFPHPEESEVVVPKQPQGPDLPGFDQMMKDQQKPAIVHRATFPMLPCRNKNQQRC